MEDKVGVFIFDSYFDVMMGLEEKYRRWDLFEAVFRYVRFDQVKRLPTELSKIFKVLKPILDVQKKKIVRNEKRRKVKRGECDGEKGEARRLDNLSLEEFGKGPEVALEDVWGENNSKIIQEKSGSTRIKSVQNIDEKTEIASVLDGCSEDVLVADCGKARDDLLFCEGAVMAAENVCFEGAQGVCRKEKNLPNGKPNVLHNENENKIIYKTEQKNSDGINSESGRLLLGGVDDGKMEDCAFGCGTPTLDEVRDFAAKSGAGVSAEEFFSYYDAKGWVLRGKPIFDWRACFLRWNERRAQRAAKHKNIDEASFEKAEAEFSHFETSYDSLSSLDEI